MALVLVVSSVAKADTVVLKDGDRLTGIIGTADSEKLVVHILGIGDVKVDMAQVDSFSTDAPTVLKFSDGTEVTQKVSALPGGMIQIDGGLLGAHPVPLSTLAAINPPPVAWTGSVQAGALFVRGNTFTDSINVGAHLERKTDQDKIAFSANYLYGSTKDHTTGVSTTTQENWQTEALYDYYFTKKFYGFLDAQVSKDRIAFLDLRFLPSLGVGYIWFNGPKLTFSTEGGVAWDYEKYTNNTPTREDFSLRLAYHVNYKFNDYVSVFHDLEYIPSVENGRNYIVNTDIGLHAKMTTHLFAEGKIILDYDSTPANGALKTDTTFLVNLGYTF